jgi:hypothetical protein
VALSQADRIAISSKVLAIPTQNASITQSQSSISASITQAQSADNANKNLVSGQTTLINAYQLEIQNLDGNTRTTILEQNLQDAVNRVQGNFFFPNTPAVPLPDVPSGMWTKFPGFYMGYGQGKDYLESYVAMPGELPLISDAQNQIAILLTKTLVTRITGQSCSSDVISADAPTQTAMMALVNDVIALQTAAQNEQSAIASNTDTNSTNKNNTSVALANIQPFLNAIKPWLSLPTFSTNYSSETDTCALFDDLTLSQLTPTKGDTVNLAYIQSLLNSRSPQVTARIAQIGSILGSITQSSTDGSFTSATGLYGARAKTLDLRINTLGGSLTQLINLQNSISALGSMQTSHNNAANVYSGVITVTGLAAGANGTAYLNVTSSVGFAAGNQIYIVSDTQPEIPAYIKSISGNQLLLDRSISAIYQKSDNGRVYLVL